MVGTNIYYIATIITCTVEIRSFSTLYCRVKTWLRSRMIDVRLDGLCMISVYREINRNEQTELSML